MIQFDDTEWTEEQAKDRVVFMIDALTDPTMPDDRIRAVGERRLLALLKAIREAREKG